MKKRFLPFSLLLVILMLGQSITIADNGGHYVPRTQGNAISGSFMGSLRANQHTGLIDPALMLKAMQGTNAKADPVAPDSPLFWISMGPDNMGGQTSAVLYDNKKNANNQPNGVVYIGAMGGGVYKTYNYGVTWHQIGDQDMMVSCMAQDANGNIYVGTGDGAAAATYNGLSQQSYDNSFIGSGIYVIDANDAVSQIASTVPTLNQVTDWSFVNDIAVMGNYLIAATNAGLKYSTDKGETWNTAVQGVAMQVKVTSNNTILASVDGQIYIGTIDNLVCHSAATMETDENGNIIAIPTATGLLDIAFAPSNENVIYASCVNTDGIHSGIYVSHDKGFTWKVALPAVTVVQGHSPYEGYGLFNHGLVVSPENEGLVYVIGYNLWKIEKPSSGTGNYSCEKVTGDSYYYLPDYLHVGLHALTFNPNNPKECYFGTDGGVYKASVNNNGEFSFTYCNRNYVTTHMFNVAYSGKDTRIMGAGVDHGSVMIEGDGSLNTLSHGQWVNPTATEAVFGAFNEDAKAGPCAISLINPKTIFVTYNGGRFQRSETDGEDWVSTNFVSSLTGDANDHTLSTSSYRLPILLFENFNDDLNPATIWYKNNDTLDIPAGTTLLCRSNNKFPFEYRINAPLVAGDSIEVHDPISARMYMSYTDVFYMTRQPLDFATETQWYLLSNSSVGFTGEPLSMGISADGDHMFVGMKGGKLYRISNLNTVVDDASGSLSDTTGSFQVTTTEIILPTEGQCVTSVAVNPNDANKVVVTLGNYGNDSYVLYSTNALADEPTFVSKQGNLPKMPVYSSIIELSTGDVILGTEHGIYRTENIAGAQWTADRHMMGDVPVMELKQQLIEQRDMVETLVSPSDTIVNFYPGVHNKGIIYAATYGKGLFRCENYKISGDGVPETPAIVEKTEVSMYPNPVRSEATIGFSMKNNANVSYQVYDLMGRLVKNVNLGRYGEGSHEVNVNVSDLTAGSYILRLIQGNDSSCVKFIVY